MYLMYVDESGDTGLVKSPTRFYVLSAIVIHELRWRQTLENLILFRRWLRDNKELYMRDEIHCTEFINKPGQLIRIKRNDRLDILKKCIDWLNGQPDLSVFSVSIDKTKNQTRDIFEYAWNALLMRFENTISYKNFPGPQNADDMGIVLSDNTDGEKLRKLVRKMRHYNIIPSSAFPGTSRNLKLQYLIEDPIFRDSKISYLHQMNDVTAYFARQMYEPNRYIKTKGGNNYYKRLTNVCQKQVSRANNYGIVEL